ncbi:MAG: PAS domain S-box protein [Candidatus Hydrogenedentes bacterium]|nr:PAS domain S-box protein [Candidatus Hydrogenedentota bacterium]
MSTDTTAPKTTLDSDSRFIRFALIMLFAGWSTYTLSIIFDNFEIIPDRFNGILKTGNVALYIAFIVFTVVRFRKLLGGLAIAGSAAAGIGLHFVSKAAGGAEFAVGTYPWMEGVWRTLDFSLGHGSIGLFLVSFSLIINALDRSLLGLKKEQEQRRGVSSALTESESKFRALAESTAAAIFILKGERCCYANPVTLKTLGYAAEEFYALDFWQFFAPETRVAARRLGSKLQQTQWEPISADMQYAGKDGAVHWGATTIAPITFQGEPAIIGTVFNITERKCAEQLLKEKEEWLRKIAQSVPDMVAVVSPDCRVTQVTPANRSEYEFALGSRLDTRELLSSVHPGDRRNVSQALQEIYEGQSKAEIIRFRCRKKDRTWGTVEASGLNLMDDPVVNGVVITARDVTRQVDLENQLHQSQKMETLGRLAGGVAHDFNNILTGILLRCQLLLEGRRPDAAAARKEIMEINKAGERAADLTRQLLTFSRQGTNDTTLIDMNEIIGDTENVLARTAGEDITLVVEKSAAPCLVRANKIQLEQVLLNLSVNACDAMPNGGRLSIRSLYLDGSTLNDDERLLFPEGCVCIEVSDTGCGMDDGTLERMFDPFFTTKPQDKGTGLGLAIVYGAVRRHKGLISARSTIGEGSSFTIKIPAADGVCAEDAHGCVQLIPVKRKKLLLVEDDVDIQALTTQILERSGFAVIGANRGEEALELFQKHRQQIDLLITDVVLPGMSGPELALRLQQQEPQLKVLYMSGYTDDKLEQYGLDVREIAYMDKPFTPNTLMQRVQGLLGEGVGSAVVEAPVQFANA